MSPSSTKKNGPQVVSKETGSSETTVGVAVNAGSRFGSKGEALLIKNAAFKGTAVRSDIKLARDIDAAGLSVRASGGREQVLFTASGMRGSAGACLAVVAEAALQPQLKGWHLAEVKKDSVAAELKASSKDAQALLVERIHAAAYGEKSPLGRTYFVDPTASALEAHVAAHFVAGNMTLVGAGIDHAELVASAEALFAGAAKGGAAAVPASPFVGGAADLDAASPLTHVAVALPGAAAGSADYFTGLVLKELLGRAAGPACSAFSVSYGDSGLVGLYGCCEPSGAGGLAECMVGALKASADDAAVASAKLAVKTQLLVGAEDSGCLAASLATLGGAFSGCGASVDGVTTAGVKAFAANALKANPAFASVGPSAMLPAHSALAKMF